ncbi:hypothetical protein ACFPN7_19620 [Amycolatopsis halotolerans]|uniref:hypothetical protein n=1 Tax=Amycolatopsis halotolerans TaxID=330083 RepID=UPI00361D3CAC
MDAVRRPPGEDIARTREPGGLKGAPEARDSTSGSAGCRRWWRRVPFTVERSELESVEHGGCLVLDFRVTEDAAFVLA